MRRIHFDKIDSSGTFRSGDIRLDAKFHDEEGNEYIWFPEWDNLMKLYAEAERVEQLNPTGDRDLEKLKELKQFDLVVLDEIAEIIADTWRGDDLKRFFKSLGRDIDYDSGTEYTANVHSMKSGGADKVRKDSVRKFLKQLNEKNYQYVIEVVEAVASSKHHIEKEDRRETVLYRLNKVLEHEGLEVTRDGIVRPIVYDDGGNRS